jgi:hypothetical protein
MNWQALNAACAFFTLGRCWNTLRDDKRVVGWWVISAIGAMLTACWPALWALCSVDLLAKRSRWFAALWCGLFRMSITEYGWTRTEGETDGQA